MYELSYCYRYLDYVGKGLRITFQKNIMMVLYNISFIYKMQEGRILKLVQLRVLDNVHASALKKSFALETMTRLSYSEPSLNPL